MSENVGNLKIKENAVCAWDIMDIFEQFSGFSEIIIVGIE